MSTTGIVPRWEWRGFGSFESAVARIEETPPEGVTGGEETYLVSRDGENTVKVRDGLLDVKRLEEIDDRGLELWRPVMKVPSPVLADDLRAVLNALGVTAPPLEHPSYRIEELLRRAVDGEVVRGVPVSKSRTRYVFLGCSAEVTEVVAAGAPLRTIALESPDPDLVMAALGELGIDPGVNTSYPRALARVAGLAGRRGTVVDIGTNSVKLHIGERTADGAWRVLADRAAVVRLGEGLLDTGAIAPAAIARTSDAVCDMAREARRAGAPEIVAVGTAGLRMATNSDAFVAAVRERCGVTVEVIPGDEEARLGYLAAIGAAARDPGARIVVAETGGGSSQFTAGSGARVVERFSIDLGAVRLTEAFGLDGPVGPDTVARARAAAADDLGRVAGLPRPDLLLGMGGAFTNLAAVHHALAEYDPAVIEGTVLDRDEIDRQIELYRAMTADGRRGITGLQAGRAEVILAGALIAGAILEALGRDAVTVTDRGLRHALVDERFREEAPA
ncbi:MAG: Ppx/GppA family phosphatase [Thermoleophilia bacterium]